MSLSNGFNKIRRNAGIKKCVLIDGNVSDVYLDPKKKIVSLADYLKEILSDLGFDNIITWDRVEGAKGALDSLTVLDEDPEVKGEEYSFDDDDETDNKGNEQGLFKKPSEILTVVYKNMVDRKRKVAFILDWSQYLFNNQGLLDDEREQLTYLGKALRDRRVDYNDEDVNESVVIMIANKESYLPLSFYQGNPEVEQVTLTKPDRDEREQMLRKVETGFDIQLKGANVLSESPDFQNYVDMTMDFSNREIVQLARLSRKERHLSFDKLYYLFKYGEKENPWEKLDYQKLKNIKEILKKRVVGQDEAIEKIESTVIKAYMGLTGLHKTSSRSMPKGVFFFVGPTGVGKTELSKALAEFLFGDDQACIRFDMSGMKRAVSSPTP